MKAGFDGADEQVRAEGLAADAPSDAPSPLRTLVGVRESSGRPEVDGVGKAELGEVGQGDDRAGPRTQEERTALRVLD